MPVIGVCLGILMGSLSGFVFWKFIDTLWKASTRQVPLIAGEILAIFTFWLGGNWLQTPFLESADTTEVLYYYILTLTCIFTPIALAKLVQRILIHFQEKQRLEESRSEGNSDD